MAREGLPNILVALILTVIAALMIFLSGGALIWRLAAFACAALLMFTLYFFRDPPRIVREDQDSILSPGDGMVVGIEDLEDDWIGAARKLTLFLSPLNVHINRYPISGRIANVAYRFGSFKAAFAPDASEVNEQNLIAIENDSLRLKCIQVSGMLARRIISYAQQGELVQQGTRYGLIKFGSRMDILFPAEWQVQVGLKEPVRGGLTVLAKRGSEQ